MPQFDTFLYITYFFTFIIYITLLYLLISLFIIPFFWNIYYFRYLKKEYNKFYTFLFNLNKEIILFETKDLINKSNSLFSTFSNNLKTLNYVVMYVYICKLLKLLSKIKTKK